MKGAPFKRVLRNVGLANLVEAARFLGISHRQAQRIAAGAYNLSRSGSLLLLTMEQWNLKPEHIDPTWKR